MALTSVGAFFNAKKNEGGKTVYWNAVPGADYYSVIRWASAADRAKGNNNFTYIVEKTTSKKASIPSAGKEGTYAYSVYACSNSGNYKQSDPCSFNINYSKKGSVIKDVLNTDIKAYIDDHPIRSFNIDGYTAVVAEDLSYYGFRVVYKNETRSLYIDEGNKKFTSVYQHPEPEAGTMIKVENGKIVTSDFYHTNSKPVGSKAMDVYVTDIKTYANGYEITGYNVNGNTIIFLDDLKAFGTTYWNQAKRAIGFYRK